MSRIYLRDDLRHAWGEEDLFDRVAVLDGEVYRAVADRRTLRIEVAGQGYFAKIHQGPGWGEIAKNLLTLRLPVLGARNEFRACRALQQAGVAAPRVAAYGERGWNPARRFSFVICDALDGWQSLEDVTGHWNEVSPGVVEKRRLIGAVAGLARAMHAAGVLHRDFYLCHFLLAPDPDAAGRPRLAIIDLHRAKVRRRLSRRWHRRDMAALLFSVLDLPLTRRDWLRFLRGYRRAPLRTVLEREGRYWQGVYRRALSLYRKGRRRGLVKGLFREDPV
jgi:heptose I phosphotransferase